jgi:alpha-ribazole phosphatase
MADFVTIRVPNGESFTDLHSRVVDFIQSEFHNTHSKSDYCSSCRNNEAFLCHISALPLKMPLKNKVDFGAVIKIEL